MRRQRNSRHPGLLPRCWPVAEARDLVRTRHWRGYPETPRHSYSGWFRSRDRLRTRWSLSRRIVPLIALWARSSCLIYSPVRGRPAECLTALRAATTEWLLVLSCDQPLIETRELAALLEGRATALAFQSASGRLHPLPCLIRVDACQSIVEAVFEEGCRSLTRLLVRCGVKTISIPDQDAERRMIDIDSPADMPLGPQSQPGPA